MASLKAIQVLSTSGMFRNVQYDSASIIAEASKAVIQLYQEAPDVQTPDFRVANIGQNPCGKADVVLQIAGSWHKRSMTGGAAWIMKDERLQTIHGSCLQTFGVSALQMDALACLHGIKWAVTHRLHNVSVYTGSRDLVQLLRESSPLDVSLLSTIQEIRCQALQLNWCCVHKVARSKIHQAHDAAIASRAGLLTPERF